MGKVGSMIRSEIMRIARHEVRQVSVPLGKDVRSLKKTASQIRKSLLAIERLVGQWQKESERREPPLEATPEEIKKARFSPRLIRILRKKLHISQKDLAALLGVSVGAVHQWEAGKFQPRTVMKGRLLALRKLNRSNVRTLLTEGGTQ